MTALKRKEVPKTLRSRHHPEMELSKGMHASSLRQTFLLLISGVVIMALFNSQGLLDWSMNLPVGPVGDRVVAVAGWWHDQMTAIGATWVRETLREGFRWFQGQ